MKQKMAGGLIFAILFIMINVSFLTDAIGETPSQGFLNQRIGFTMDRLNPNKGRREAYRTVDEFVTFLNSKSKSINWKKYEETKWLYSIKIVDEATNKGNRLDFLLQLRKNKYGLIYVSIDKLICDGVESSFPDIYNFYKVVETSTPNIHYFEPVNMDKGPIKRSLKRSKE